MSVTTYPKNKIELNDGMIVDRQNDLSLYHANNDGKDFFQRKIRGLLLDKSSNVIMDCLPVPLELRIDDHMLDDILGDFTTVKISNAIEGTVIRVFNHNGEWIMSTSKKIDARNSFWGSRTSHGQMFTEAIVELYNTRSEFKNELDKHDSADIINKFFNTLDTERKYVFLLSSNCENRIVCNGNSTSDIYFLGCMLNGEIILDIDTCPYFNRVETVSLQNIKELETHIQNIDIGKNQGVIIQTREQDFIKVYNSEYKNRFDIRGNQSNLIYRYLELRRSEFLNRMLHDMYPLYVSKFEHCEKLLLGEIANDLSRLYTDRYITKKPFETIEWYKHVILKTAHDWYQRSPKNNRVNIDIMRDIINEQQPNVLFKLVTSYSLEVL